MADAQTRADSSPQAGALARARAAVASGLTPRAVLVGALCVLLVSFVTSWAELYIQRISIGLIQFPPGAFGVFVLLIIGNRLLRRVRPRWALRAQELAICYAMMLLSAMTASRGAPRRLIALLTSINYEANPTNHWQETFFGSIPQQLVPWNTAQGPLQPVVLAMYEGLHYGEPIPWHPWVMPLLRWLVVVLLVFGSFLCLGTLLRRQWVDNERLSFPLAQLPIEMLRAEEGEPFYRHRLLYLGAAVPILLHLVNLAHNINPNVPQIQWMFELNPLFASPPLNRLSTFRLYIGLSAIGFFFLLPAELLFSFWFCYLFLAKGHEAILLLLGQTLDRPGHADTSLYMASAEAGGFFVLAAYFFWMSRPLLLSALKGVGGQDEMMRYRPALIGLTITLAAAAVWYYLAGLALWLGVMEFVVYVLVIALVMTRATAEGGLLMTEIIFTPLDVYGMFGRRQMLGGRNLTVSIFATEPFAGDMRGLTLQGIMDSQKIADSIGLRRRSLYGGLWIGIIASLLAGFFIQLWMNYRIGAMGLNNQFQWLSGVFYQEHHAFLAGEERANAWAPISFFLGAGFTALLAFLRLQFYWWPLHPLGFVMCGSWSLVVYWFPIFAAWLVKTIIVHYGGLRGYRRARPFFLGLICGEMTAAVVFTLLDAIWHIPAPFIPFD